MSETVNTQTGTNTTNTQTGTNTTAMGPLLRLGIHIGAVLIAIILFTVLVVDLLGSTGTSGLAWTMAGLLVAVAAGQGAFLVLSRNHESTQPWADEQALEATDDVPADDLWALDTAPIPDDGGAWDTEAAWGEPVAEAASEPAADTAWPEHETQDETIGSDGTAATDDTAWPEHETAEADDTAWSEETAAEADDDVYTVGCPSCGTAFTITAEVAAQGELHCVHCGVTGEIVDEELQKDRIEDVTCDDCSEVYAAHGATSTCPHCGARHEAPVAA